MIETTLKDNFQTWVQVEWNSVESMSPYSLQNTRGYPNLWKYKRTWLRMTYALSIKINAPKLGRLICPVVALHTFDEVHFFFVQLKIKNLEILLESLKF